LPEHGRRDVAPKGKKGRRNQRLVRTGRRSLGEGRKKAKARRSGVPSRVKSAVEKKKKGRKKSV